MNIWRNRKYSPTDGFNVIDTQGFDETISTLEKALEAYANARTTLQREGSALCDSWKGTGGEQFSKSFTALMQGMVDDEDSLHFIKERLVTGYALYNSADQTGASSLNEICHIIPRHTGGEDR